MYSNIKVYQKYQATSIKVGCATRSLYASSGPKAEGVPTNNQRGRGSGPCRLWGGLDKARHIVPTALLVRVQRFRNDLYKAVKVLLNNAYWQLINTQNDLLMEYLTYSCLMKTKFRWTSSCWKDIENTSVAFSLISSIYKCFKLISFSSLYQISFMTESYLLRNFLLNICIPF